MPRFVNAGVNKMIAVDAASRRLSCAVCWSRRCCRCSFQNFDDLHRHFLEDRSGSNTPRRAAEGRHPTTLNNCSRLDSIGVQSIVALPPSRRQMPAWSRPPTPSIPHSQGRTRRPPGLPTGRRGRGNLQDWRICLGLRHPRWPCGMWWGPGPEPYPGPLPRALRPQPGPTPR